MRLYFVTKGHLFYFRLYSHLQFRHFLCAACDCVCAAGMDRSARRLLAQAQVFGVEPRQHVAGSDLAADLGAALDHLAADAKREPRLGAGADLGGVVLGTASGRAGDGRRAHGAHRFGRRLRARAAGKREDQGDRSGRGRRSIHGWLSPAASVRTPVPGGAAF